MKKNQTKVSNAQNMAAITFMVVLIGAAFGLIAGMRQTSREMQADNNAEVVNTAGVQLDNCHVEDRVLKMSRPCEAKDLEGAVVLVNYGK